jgi:hypothetical protein
MLNDTTYVEAARVLAERLLKAASGDPQGVIRGAYLAVLAREPSREETALWTAALQKRVQSFGADPDGVARLLKVGAAPRDVSLPAAEHAAYTTLCLSVLNLDEALTKE